MTEKCPGHVQTWLIFQFPIPNSHNKSNLSKYNNKQVIRSFYGIAEFSQRKTSISFFDQISPFSLIQVSSHIYIPHNIPQFSFQFKQPPKNHPKSQEKKNEKISDVHLRKWKFKQPR